MDQAVFDTLKLALEEARVQLPDTGTILFLRAERSSFLASLPKTQLICAQTFKPDYDALKSDGYTVLPPDTQEFPRAEMVILLPPRQKDEARGLYARGMAALVDGGVLLACLPNTLGSKTAEKTLRSLAGNSEALSKHKCRAFWAVKTNDFSNDLHQEWVAKDAPAQMPGEPIMTRPGLFSWNRVDAGSMLLAENLPEDLKGRGADLGAGQGYLSLDALIHCPGITHIDLYEAEHRALDCAATSLHGVDPEAARHAIHWHDVAQGLPQTGYDFILTNPPFHTGREDRAALGQAFIRAAARALHANGELFLVANRHLPYEHVLTASFKTTEMIEDAGGYKIIHAARPKKLK